MELRYFIKIWTKIDPNLLEMRNLIEILSKLRNLIEIFWKFDPNFLKVEKFDRNFIEIEKSDRILLEKFLMCENCSKLWFFPNLSRNCEKSILQYSRRLQWWVFGPLNEQISGKLSRIFLSNVLANDVPQKRSFWRSTAPLPTPIAPSSSLKIQNFTYLVLFTNYFKFFCFLFCICSS